jgi:hypothetical protein
MSPYALKERLTTLPVTFFKALTFGELKIGERFIVLPGILAGHAPLGLKDVHFVFTKTDEQVHEFLGTPHTEPHGRATYNMRSRFADIPHETPILCVK